MELKRYLLLFRRRWIVLLACTVVGAAIGWATVPGGTSYQASSAVYLGTRSLEQNQSQLYAEPGLLQVVATYAAMIPSSAFCRLALAGSKIDRDAGTVAAETKAAVVPGTTLIDVIVTDSDPVIAQRLANQLSEAFARSAQSGQIRGPAQPGSVPAESAYVFQTAEAPGTPLPKGTARHILLGAVFGIIIAVLAVLFVDYLDTTVRGPDSIERRLGLPVLAVVPRVARVPVVARSHTPTRGRGGERV